LLRNTVQLRQQKALKWLSVFVFLLFAAPKIHLRIGPVPVYLIDLILFLTWYHSRPLNVLPKSEGLSVYVKAILGFAIVSEVFFALRTFDFVNPLYLGLRTWLAFSIFFSIQRILRNEWSFRKILVPIFWGSTITASFLVLSSLPFTRFLVNPIFDIGFLEPASESVVEEFSDLESAKRGRSLVGVSILSGAFVNAAWPLLLGLRNKRYQLGSRIKKLLPLATILMPLGVFMTYSRGAILGAIFVILVIQIFNTGKYRRQLIALLSIGAIGINIVGWNSNVFYTERLEKTTNRTLTEGFSSTNERETERFDAYVEPFEHVVTYPEYFILGEGASALKGSKWNPFGIYMGGFGNRADHAVFAKSFYAYGLIAACLYFILLFKSGWSTYQNCFKSNNPKSYIYSRMILASIAGISTWFFFGHAAISAPRGAMLFFFVMGLAEVQKNLFTKPSLKFNT
jgi:hypothetical protein